MTVITVPRGVLLKFNLNLTQFSPLVIFYLNGIAQLYPWNGTYQTFKSIDRNLLGCLNCFIISIKSLDHGT